MNHVFLRHPPLPQAAGLCYGRQDIALPDDIFADAAVALRERLPELPMLSSPAQRCLRLARACAGDRAVRIDARLLEMHFGAWEGRLWSQLPRTELDRWRLDVAGFRPPGGECFHDVVARLGAVLDELGAPHLVITHAGVIRAAMHVIGGMPVEQAAGFQVPYLDPIAIHA